MRTVPFLSMIIYNLSILLLKAFGEENSDGLP